MSPGFEHQGVKSLAQVDTPGSGAQTLNLGMVKHILEYSAYCAIPAHFFRSGINTYVNIRTNDMECMMST
jgi:hypothetical protein